jgi:phage-related protein
MARTLGRPLVWRKGDQAWRIVYCAAHDAVVILDVFSKKTQATPKAVVVACRERLAAYRATVKAGKERI